MAGLVAGVAALACLSLASADAGVLVAERIRTPDSPRLWIVPSSDTPVVDTDLLKLQCTYFTGRGLDRQVHADDLKRIGTPQCPFLRPRDDCGLVRAIPRADGKADLWGGRLTWSRPKACPPA